MEKVYSERGKPLIIYEKNSYRFLKDIKSTSEQCWRCSRGKHCNAKLYTLEDGSVFSRVLSNHNHDPVEEKVLNRKTVNNAVKRKIEDIEGEKPAQKIRKVAEELEKPLSTLTRQDVSCIRNNLYRAKSKTMPKLPKTTEELQTALENITTTTSKGEEFLLVNDRDNKIVIFSCDENLKFLSESETIFMDGTFEYAPKHSLQMFTIHGFSNGVYVPLVFCLLKDKKKETYINAIKSVQEECLKRRLQLQPRWIVVDFEQSIHECIKIILPETKIVGCRFHLGQSW
jgi:DNA-binding protein Fis